MNKSVVKKSKNLTIEEKKKLARIIECRKPIWEYPRTESQKELTKLWLEVAKEMKKSVTDCKHGWKALKNHKRNRAKVREKFGLDCNSEDSEDEKWVSKYLKFYKSHPRKTKTSNSIFISKEIEKKNNDSSSISLTSGRIKFESNNSIDISDETEENCNDYLSISPETILKEEPDSSLCNEIRAVQQNMYRLNQAPKISCSNNEVSPTKGLQYNSMYVNMDEMLKKLPETEVYELNIEFMKMILQRIKAKR